MTEIEHQGTVAMEVTPAPQSSQAEFFRLIAKHYMNALENIVTEATNLETCHRLACEALGSPPPTRIEPPINDLVGRLRRYRPRDEFGDPVKHTICNEAADEIERLRTPAPQDHVVPPELCRLTFAVQHNPNCPSPWLVRLPGKGPIDMLPYGDPLRLVKHQTGDVLGFGKSFDEAARAALAASEGSTHE